MTDLLASLNISRTASALGLLGLPAIGLWCAGAGCATSGDPQDPSTETEASVTATFTTGGADEAPDPSADDDDDDADDDGGPTSDAVDSSTGAGGSAGGTGDSTGATTGCEDGTEGCACLADADPSCAEGLECEDGVCVAPMCPTDEDEPNDLQSEAIHFGDFNDGAPPQQLTGVLAGTEDVDWWSYHCADDLLEEVDPVSQLTADPMPRLCVFMDCDEGGNPILPGGCPAGTVEDQAPTGFLPGCCATDGAEIDLTDFNCPDSDDESITVLFRIDDGPQDACIDTAIDFHC